jgi:ParB-like chromosome segregation protein Spo0J
MKSLLSRSLSFEDAYNIALEGREFKERNDIKEAGRETAYMAPRSIPTHRTFEHLLPIEKGELHRIIADMAANGYYDSQPVVLGRWPGQETPVLIDGHSRVKAAIENRIAKIPFKVVEFENEVEAMRHAVSLQTKRRSNTDSVLYRLCERYDRIMERGGDRRSAEVRSRYDDTLNKSGRSRSARLTGEMLGCNYKKVEKIRKIIRDGTDEVKRAVSSGRYTINQAYELVKTKKKKEEIKTIKKQINFTEDNYEALNKLVGSLDANVNRAIKQYIESIKAPKIDQ